MKGVKRKAAEKFDDLHIYQRARDLTNEIYRLTRVSAFARDTGMVNQIRRASVSIMSNVAEGFERGTTTEFVQFPYVAEGSCGEVRAQLQVAVDQQYISVDDHSRLTDLCRRISGMISNFIAHLQRSTYDGEKISRPRRQAADAAQRRFEAARQAELVNIRAAEERKKSDLR